MGIAWALILGIFGLLIGFGALVDRRRYRGRGEPVAPELSGRARRDAIRASRAQFAHVQMASGGNYIGFASGSEGIGGGHGGGGHGGGGNCGGDGGGGGTGC